MPQSKEILEDLRERVINAHQAGKGYKCISKEIGLHECTVRQIYSTNGGNSAPQLLCQRVVVLQKNTPRAWRVVLREVTKNLRGTSKHLQATLALNNFNVHESTIREALNKNGVHGRIVGRKPLLSKKRTLHVKFAEDHVDKPEIFWISASDTEWLGRVQLLGL